MIVRPEQPKRQGDNPAAIIEDHVVGRRRRSNNDGVGR
jgi:hypothetical protein